jgi:hypothetical protein
VQDTFINLGRGIDGVVGRMVDRFGDVRGDERLPDGETVELLRYVIVSVSHDHERVLHVDETLLTVGATGKESRLHLVDGPRHAAPAPGPSSPVSAPPHAQPPPEATPVTSGSKEQVPASAELRSHVSGGSEFADDLDHRLLSALAEADDAGLSMAQLVKRTGERSAKLRGRLQRLGREGKILRAGDGLKTRYRMTDQ